MSIQKKGKIKLKVQKKQLKQSLKIALIQNFFALIVRI